MSSCFIVLLEIPRLGALTETSNDDATADRMNIHAPSPDTGDAEAPRFLRLEFLSFYRSIGDLGVRRAVKALVHSLAKNDDGNETIADDRG